MKKQLPKVHPFRDGQEPILSEELLRDLRDAYSQHHVCYIYQDTATDQTSKPNHACRVAPALAGIPPQSEINSAFLFGPVPVQLIGYLDTQTGRIVNALPPSLVSAILSPPMMPGILRTYLDKDGAYEDRDVMIEVSHDFAQGPYQDTVPFTVGSNQTILPHLDTYEHVRKSS